jgi:hypothetical protein
VVVLQADDDVAIHRADRARGAVGHVDGAVRQADAVDDRVDFLRRDQPADLALDLVEQRGGLLDAGAGGGAGMQGDGAAVHLGEEVAAEEGHQRQAAEGEDKEQREGGFARREGEAQQAAITG